MMKIRIAEWLIALAIMGAMAAQINEFEPELVNKMAETAKTLLNR